MKKLFLGMLISTVAFNSFAKDSMFSHLKNNWKDYSIPCAVSLLATQALMKEDKMQAGLSLCLGVGSAQYIVTRNQEDVEIKQAALELKMNDELVNMKKTLKDEMKKDILEKGQDEIVNEMKAEVYSKIQKSLTEDKEFISQMLSKLNKEFDEYKVVISNVLSQKLQDFQKDNNTNIEKSLLEGPFIPLLEEKIMKSIRTQSKKAFDENKDDFIKECVDKSISDIQLKPVVK